MSDRPGNAFLRSIHEDSHQALAQNLTPVRLSHGEVLYRSGDPVHWVYFPLSGLLSVLTETRDGEAVETAMVGNEGGLGLTEALGSGVVSATCLVQVDGEALRMPAAAFRSLVSATPDILARTVALFEMQLAESRQSGLCQAVHTVEPRFARWLIESMERSGGRALLPLTQEFIAAMLGVQRTTVNAFATQLQKAGLIRYVRGSVQLLDPTALERRACECLGEVREQRRRLGLEALRIES